VPPGLQALQGDIGDYSMNTYTTNKTSMNTFKLIIHSKLFSLLAFIFLSILIGILIVNVIVDVRLISPKLVVSNLDLGTFVPGSELERTIAVTNKGWRTLNISDVNTCCGCTIRNVPLKIAGGSTGFLSFKLRTPNGCGEFRREIKLATNDPKNRRKRVVLHGLPDNSIIAKPVFINLGHVVPGVNLSDIIELQAEDTNQFNPYVVTSAPYLKASLHSCQVEGSVRIGLEITKDAPRGKIAEYLYSKTGIDGRPNIIIPISGTIERGLRIRPEVAYFGSIGRNQAITRSVRLQVLDPIWKEIRVVVPEEDMGISANLERKNDNNLILNVVLDPSETPPVLSSCVVLKNSMGDTLEIPVYAVRKGAGESKN
jgi:hypothetical protein